MPIEFVLVALVAVAVVVVIVPAGRRSVATAVDLIDGSVGMFAVRSWLGLDTTTARQRRIDRRRAREQAEIRRRIGASDGAEMDPASTAPNRLVVSGRSPDGAPLSRMPPAGPLRRRTLRNGIVAAVVVVIVAFTAVRVADQPSGDVLGATATPRERTGVVRASSSVPSPTDPAAEPGGASGGSPGPVVATGAAVGALAQRLTGDTAGGETVDVVLSWEPVPGSGAAAGYELDRQVDGAGYELVAALGPDVTMLEQTLPIGATSSFRIRAIGADGTSGETAAWPPITPGRHQEASRLATLQGAWRRAAGPSLSGGRVAYTRARSASVAFRFRGTDVGWVATRTPMSGRAEVTIDGERVAAVDLGAPSVRYRQLVFRQHLAGDTEHLLEIRSLGGGRVDVDAFVVLR
ncbi:MAG: hypothetical protein OEV61_04445 [Chloroflexota bacterium]|nr:hypothetical protein [Chloroflexota bacterium]MDH5243607.1 hypothetical protein [Chloroflexota bacterium]